MKIKKLILFLMITWHFLYYFNQVITYDLSFMFPIFPTLWGFVSETRFWMGFLFIEAFLALKTLGSDVTVKTTNITNFYQDKEENKDEKNT